MSIKGKVFLYLLAFCALLLALLWLFQVTLLESVYRQVKLAEAKAVMRTLEERLGSEDFQQTVDRLAQEHDFTIWVGPASSPEQRRVADAARRSGGELLEYPKTETLPHAEPGQPPGTPKPMHVPQPMRISYAKIMERPGESASLLLITAMISPVTATVSTLRFELYAITAIMVLFSLALALLIARRVARPIEAVNAAAKQLAKGNYNVSFATKGYREISELSHTLNVAARELNTVERLRRELIANISHDLRTPLTLIGGYAEAMRDLPGENTPANAQVIVEEARRLSSLVSAVLDLSKMQSGSRPLRLSPYNLTKSLRDIVNRTAAFVRDQGYTIRMDADEDAEVTADEELVAQAFYNLLINALNHTGPDQCVHVWQKVEDGDALPRVTIHVTDTGKGIALDDLPRIWERYYRTEENHARAIAGSGLGLSIVQTIVQQHAGQCGVRSEPGHGSTFFLTLTCTAHYPRETA